MAEVAALLAMDELLASDYDEIIVDTAPMGHAIRLFQMPEHFARFLEVLEIAASRDAVLARHFGGKLHREPALERWSRMLERLQAALAVQGSKLVLVTTPEPFSLNEARRSADAFAGRKMDEVVLNRAVANAGSCAICKIKAEETRRARTFLARNFRGVTVLTAEDAAGPILGVPQLRGLAVHIFDGKSLPEPTPPKSSASPRLKKVKWPALQRPLTLTLGKGGVGKTTISAALASHHRSQAPSERVTVCSIDPAPSLDDVFEAKVGEAPRAVLGDPKLRAVELDAMAEFARWSQRIGQSLDEAMTGEQQGIHVDLSLDRRFLRALLDVVPPGVDEIFGIFRILELLDESERVVIDMAPTGHALELLRTPQRLLGWARALLKTLAAHRTLPIAQDAAVEIASLSQRVRELATLLVDGRRCAIMAVTLAEPLPDFETVRLLRDLARMKSPVAAVFVNRVLMAQRSGCRRCTLKMRWQNASLASMRRRLRGVDIYIAADMGGPVAGRAGLKQFTSELWQLG